MEGFYSFWQVVRVHEPLPTTILKILTWHTDIFQKALIGIGVFAIGPCRPDEAWYRVDDLTKLVFAFPNGFLRLSSIINIDFISLVSGGSVALWRFRLLARALAVCCLLWSARARPPPKLRPTRPLVYDGMITAGILPPVK